MGLISLLEEKFFLSRESQLQMGVSAAIKNGEIPVDKTTPDMSREFEQFVPTSYPGDQTGDVPTAREPVN